MSETVVIIRPSFKKICGDNDACRAAIFNQMLYNIAWKIKQGAESWYGTAEEICESIDNSWSVHKVRNEIDKLAQSGLLGRNHKKGYDRTYLYSFGKEQGQKLKALCRKIGIFLHHLGLPTDVLSLLIKVGAAPETCDCPTCKQHEVTPHVSNMENGNAISGTSKSPKRELQTPYVVHPFLGNGCSSPEDTAKESSKKTAKGQAKEGEAPSSQRNTEPLPVVLPSLPETMKELSCEEITPDTPHSLESILAIGAHYLGDKVSLKDAEAFVRKTESTALLVGAHEVRTQLVRNITFMLYSDHVLNWYRNKTSRVTLWSAVTYYDDYVRKVQETEWLPPPDKLPDWYSANETPSQQQSEEDYFAGMSEQEAATLSARILVEFPGIKLSWGDLPGGRCTVGLWNGDGSWCDLWRPYEWDDGDLRLQAALDAYKGYALEGVA